MGGGHWLPFMLINGNQIDLVCSEPEGKVKCYFKYPNHVEAILFEFSTWDYFKASWVTCYLIWPDSSTG